MGKAKKVFWFILAVLAACEAMILIPDVIAGFGLLGHNVLGYHPVLAGVMGLTAFVASLEARLHAS